MAGMGKKNLTKSVKKNKKKVRADGKPRGPKKCAKCRLHGIQVLQSREHSKICPYNSCQNFLCWVTSCKQRIMKVQLDVWRERNKYIAHIKKNEKTLCDKCRNHLNRTNKKGHKKLCSFNNCEGIMCRMTVARRNVVSFFLKIMRSFTRCEDFEIHYQKAISAKKAFIYQDSFKQCLNTHNGIRKNNIPAVAVMKPCKRTRQDKIEYPLRTYHQRSSDIPYCPEDAYYSNVSTFYPNCVHYHNENIYFTEPLTSVIAFESYHNRPKICINYANYNLNSSKHHTNGMIFNGINERIKHNMNSNCHDYKCFYRPWL